MPATISIAKILKRFDQSCGLGLFSFSPEQDTLTNSNKRGGWSQKSDLYRIAFDGEEYGQDYMSDNSYSTSVRVRYNLLSTGTPKALERYYNDAEDGLVSRCIFGSLANQQFRSMPVWGKFTKAQQRIIDTKLRDAFALSYDEEGKVKEEYLMRLPWLCGEMNIWLERKRVEAAKAGSMAMDTFRRRAAVNGFRAGMMAHWLWGENLRHRKEVSTFAIFIAELTLDGQMKRYADQLEGEDVRTSMSKEAKKKRSTELFESLPETFTTSDVTRAAATLHIVTPSRNLIYGWHSAGLIERLANNQYHKISSEM